VARGRHRGARGRGLPRAHRRPLAGHDREGAGPRGADRGLPRGLALGGDPGDPLPRRPARTAARGSSRDVTHARSKRH
jgi:hypothetical protein